MTILYTLNTTVSYLRMSECISIFFNALSKNAESAGSNAKVDKHREHTHSSL